MQTMSSVLIVPLLFHAVVLAVNANFLGSAWSEVRSAAHEGRQEVSAAAHEVGTAAVAVSGRAESVAASAAHDVGAAAADASGKVARVAADAALRQSGKCEVILRGRHKIEPIMSPLLARGLQEGQENPSADAATCRKAVSDICLAELDRAWHDATGLSGKIVAGLSGELFSYFCGPPLMSSLRSQEAIRKSDPTAYSNRIQGTLRESVFTDAWVQDLLAAHCGGLPATRLFTASRPMRAGSRSPASVTTAAIAACLSAAAPFSVAALLAALFAAALRRRRRQRTGIGAPALLASEASSDKAGEASEEDMEAIE